MYKFKEFLSQLSQSVYPILIFILFVKFDVLNIKSSKTKTKKIILKSIYIILFINFLIVTISVQIEIIKSIF